MKHIHFIGIGGAGLSALAYILLARGYKVSGSDTAPGAVTETLAKRGARIFVGHAPQYVEGADCVVTTSAATADNPEIVAALLQQIPVLKRREFLRTITAGYDVIAVAGSHGKTTTTALIAVILTAAGLDPTVVVGGILAEWGVNARAGQSQWFVIEADEYDNAFLGLVPEVAVLTNVDYDHPDLFPTPEQYRAAFATFLAQIHTEGLVIVCGDEPVACALASASARRVRTYGLNPGNDWRAAGVERNDHGGMTFAVERGTKRMGSVSLRIPGEHNVLNALAALAAADAAGIAFDTAGPIVETFTGVARRFQLRGTYHGAVLIDDYAHHPTEVRATLRAARLRYPQARLWALLQPHTFTRTRALLDEFAAVLREADCVLVTEIYAARERDSLGISGREVVEQMGTHRARFVATLEEAETILRNELRAGDVLITFGAGHVNQVAERLSEIQSDA